MKKLFFGIVLLLAGFAGIGYSIYILNSADPNHKKKNEQNSNKSTSQSTTQSLQCTRSLEKLKKLNSLQQKNNQKLQKKIKELEKERVEIEPNTNSNKIKELGLDSVKSSKSKEKEQETDTNDDQNKKEAEDSQNKVDSKEKVEKNDEKPKNEKKKRLNYIMVYYAKGKEEVSSSYEAKVKDLANYFKDHRFRIGVRTGDSDSLVNNKKLARHRARKLRAILQQAGIASKDISYRIFPGNPADKPDKPYTSSYWRRARIKAISKGDR